MNTTTTTTTTSSQTEMSKKLEEQIHEIRNQLNNPSFFKKLGRRPSGWGTHHSSPNQHVNKRHHVPYPKYHENIKQLLQRNWTTKVLYRSIWKCSESFQQIINLSRIQPTKQKFKLLPISRKIQQSNFTKRY